MNNCEDLWAIAVQCTVYIRKTVPNDVCWNSWSIFQIDHNSTHQQKQRIAVSKAITRTKTNQYQTDLNDLYAMAKVVKENPAIDWALMVVYRGFNINQNILPECL